MLVATTLGVLLIPVFYVVIRRMIPDNCDGTEEAPGSSGGMQPVPLRSALKSL